ncbi:MAG TPA: branched chain amino acid aminotransferase, partial [Chitinophagales bacterium]|nr:branched chain amino acid aminotransferase [Chitinophagales bacterium]
RLTEMFGTGTAAVVNPINRFGYKGKDYLLDDTKLAIATKIKETLVNIQKCKSSDIHGWVLNV